MSEDQDAGTRACPDCGNLMPLTLDHHASAAGCDTWSREWTCETCDVRSVEVYIDEGEVTFYPVGRAPQR